MIKLGGSAITDKSKEFSVRLEVIKRIPEEISPALPDLVLVHGAGSYGHGIAKRSRIYEGYKDKSQLLAASFLKLKMQELTGIIHKTLLESNIPAFPIYPSSFMIFEDGRPKQRDISPLLGFFRVGLIPLVPPDGAFDLKRGFSIVSGDVSAAIIAKELKAEKLIFCVDVDGVLKDGEVVRELDPEGAEEIADSIDISTQDVTGGMSAKLRIAADVARSGIPVYIVNLMVPGRLKALLEGKDVPHTVIRGRFFRSMEKLERIIKGLLNLQPSAVFELESRIPKDEEEAIAKAYALAVYAKVVSAFDLFKAAEIARKAIETLPEERDEKHDERVRKALAMSLRILSVEAYKRGNKEEAKRLLKELSELAERAEDEETKAFGERAKAYLAALFGEKYDASRLLRLDLKDPVVFAHAIRSALALGALDILEEILRRGLLLGTLSALPPSEIAPALEAIGGRKTEKAEAVIAFFSEKDEGFSSEVAKFAINRRDRELRERIKQAYRGTALEILALLEEAREDPKRVDGLLKRLEELDLNEYFKQVVEAEARIIKAHELHAAGLYEESLKEALKALQVENIDLLVAAYRIAIEDAIRIDSSLALRLIDEAYERLKDYRSHEAVSRLLNVLKGLKPLLLLSQKNKIEAFVEALKGAKRKKK